MSSPCPAARRLLSTLDVRGSTRRFDAGFTLIESVVAIGILTSVLVGVLGLFAQTVSANASARRAGLALILANTKLEELRLPPARAVGSPPGSLWNDSTGFCERIDEAGQSLGDCALSSAGAPFVRRWSVSGSASPDGSDVVQVAVSWGAASVSSGPRASVNEVRLSTVFARSGS